MFLVLFLKRERRRHGLWMDGWSGCWLKKKRRCFKSHSALASFHFPPLFTFYLGVHGHDQGSGNIPLTRKLITLLLVFFFSVSGILASASAVPIVIKTKTFFLCHHHLFLSFFPVMRAFFFLFLVMHACMPVYRGEN
ncbi:hypothetical protein QBC43DRAFT_130045 [Cladorrhinum sp. PSN259]|nr:hypothetical protein QBC43DRAFT_130045 [Cladorrhinum sp. PSN259]